MTLYKLSKFIHNIDNLNCSDFFDFNVNKTRNSNLKLQKEYAKTNSRNNFLSLRIFDAWNALSETTRTVDTVLKFKICIDRELKDSMYIYE